MSITHTCLKTNTTFRLRLIQSSKIIMNREQLIGDYVEAMIDTMTPEIRTELLYDFMVDMFEEYTLEEMKSEAEYNFPHLLSD